MAPSHREDSSNTTVGSCSNDSSCVSVVLGCLIPILVVASLIPIMLAKRRFDARRAARILRKSRVRSSVHVRSQIVQVAPHTPRLPVKSVYIARVNYYLPAPPTMESDLCTFPSSGSIFSSVSKESDVQPSASENPCQPEGPSTSREIQQSAPLISLPSLSSMLGEFSAYADVIDPELPELSGQVRRSSTCILTEANSRLSTTGVFNSRLSVLSSTTSRSSSAESNAKPDDSQVMSVEDAVRLMATLEGHDTEPGYETTYPSIEPVLEPASSSSDSQCREALFTGAESLVIEGTTTKNNPLVKYSASEQEEEDQVVTQLTMSSHNSADTEAANSLTGQESEVVEEMCTSGTTSRSALLSSTTVLSVTIDTTLSLSTLGSVLAVKLDEFPAVPSFMPVNVTQNMIRSSFSGAQSALEDLGESMLRPHHSSTTMASFSTSTTSLTRSISAPATLNLTDFEGELESFSREALFLAQLHLPLPFSQVLSAHLADIFGQTASDVRACIFPASRSRQSADGPGDLWDEEDEALFTPSTPLAGKDTPCRAVQKRDFVSQRGRYTWTAGMAVRVQGCQTPLLIPDLSETKKGDKEDTEGDLTGELWDDEDERRFSGSSLLSVGGVPQLSASATTASVSSLTSMVRERSSYRRSLRKSAIATLASLEGLLNLSVSLSDEQNLAIGMGKDFDSGGRVSALDVGSLSVLASLAMFTEGREGDAWVEEVDFDGIDESGSAAAVDARADPSATMNDDTETFGDLESPPSSGSTIDYHHISESVSLGAQVCDTNVSANANASDRMHGSPIVEAYPAQREPEVNHQAAKSSRSLQELLLLLETGLPSQGRQVDEESDEQSYPSDDGDVTQLRWSWSPGAELSSVFGDISLGAEEPQRSPPSALGLWTEVYSTNDRNPDCASMVFAQSCPQPSEDRDMYLITTGEDSDCASLRSSMNDVLENGEPLVDIDVRDIHCTELSFTDSLTSSSNLVDFVDGIDNLLDIEEFEVVRRIEDEERYNSVDVEQKQHVEQESANDMLEIFADASLIYSPNREEALSYVTIENNYVDESTKQRGADAGPFELELFQRASDHVLDVFADARCVYDPCWIFPSVEENQLFSSAIKFEKDSGQEFFQPASGSRIPQCTISEEVYRIKEDVSRLLNNRSGKVNEENGGSTRDESIDYLVSGSGSCSQVHVVHDHSELFQTSETLEKDNGSLTDDLSFIVKMHELRLRNGSEVRVHLSTSVVGNLDKSSSSEASFSLSAVDDSGYNSCEADMCNTVKLARQSGSESLLRDLSLSKDKRMILEDITIPCANHETAATSWMHDHIQYSVKDSEDEFLRTTSETRQLEQSVCIEGDHDDQEKFRSASDAGVVGLLPEGSGSQHLFTWSNIDHKDHVRESAWVARSSVRSMEEPKPYSLPDSEQTRESDFMSMDHEDLVANTNSNRSSICSTTSVSTWISCMSLASVLYSDIYFTTDQQRFACSSPSSRCGRLGGEDADQIMDGKKYEWSTASDVADKYLRSDIDSDLGEIDMEIETDYSDSSYLSQSPPHFDYQ